MFLIKGTDNMQGGTGRTCQIVKFSARLIFPSLCCASVNTLKSIIISYLIVGCNRALDFLKFSHLCQFWNGFFPGPAEIRSFCELGIYSFSRKFLSFIKHRLINFMWSRGILPFTLKAQIRPLKNLWKLSLPSYTPICPQQNKFPQNVCISTFSCAHSHKQAKSHKTNKHTQKPSPQPQIAPRPFVSSNVPTSANWRYWTVPKQHSVRRR